MAKAPWRSALAFVQGKLQWGPDVAGVRDFFGGWRYNDGYVYIILYYTIINIMYIFIYNNSNNNSNNNNNNNNSNSNNMYIYI